jgi:hypothetical protein
MRETNLAAIPGPHAFAIGLVGAGQALSGDL